MPQAKQLAEVAAQVNGRARAVVSILAATTTAELEAAYPDVPGVPVHPEHPRRGAPGRALYVPGSRAQEGPEAEILELFGRAGTIIALAEESLIEPAMALMSCGPAFMALIAESFADAGADHGLERADALRMTVETMAGTAAYLREHDYDTEAVDARGHARRHHRARPDPLEERGVRDVSRAAVDAVVEAARR